MEELYQDLGQLRRRLEEVQAGIDDKSDMYTTLFHRWCMLSFLPHRFMGPFPTTFCVCARTFFTVLIRHFFAGRR